MEHDNDHPTRCFIVSWCNTGLEAVVPHTRLEMEKTFSVLSGKPSAPHNIHSIVQTMILRAKFNTQRAYEIYAVHAARGIDEEDIREMFSNDPQGSADTMRRIGQKIHSNRASAERIVIT